MNYRRFPGVSGSIRSDRWGVIATYPTTQARSVILSRETKIEVVVAMKRQPWCDVGFLNVEIVGPAQELDNHPRV